VVRYLIDKAISKQGATHEDLRTIMPFHQIIAEYIQIALKIFTRDSPLIYGAGF
jgi:hypothetical protein